MRKILHLFNNLICYVNLFKKRDIVEQLYASWDDNKLRYCNTKSKVTQAIYIHQGGRLSKECRTRTSFHKIHKILYARIQDYYKWSLHIGFEIFFHASSCTTNLQHSVPYSTFELPYCEELIKEDVLQYFHILSRCRVKAALWFFTNFTGKTKNIFFFTSKHIADVGNKIVIRMSKPPDFVDEDLTKEKELLTQQNLRTTTNKQLTGEQCNIILQFLLQNKKGGTLQRDVIKRAADQFQVTPITAL
ncbi:hypothetical protein C0J52_10688 [Blattella germanica]|nr:hypothetical protein C0J52_10688 [Blattella germanica]